MGTHELIRVAWGASEHVADVCREGSLLEACALNVKFGPTPGSS